MISDSSTERVGQYANDLLKADLAFRRGEGLLFPATRTSAQKTARAKEDLSSQLFESRAAGKIATAQIAMHLDRDWRDGFFRQLDSLLDADEWEPDDEPVTQLSYKTFLRTIVHLGATRRPGIGASEDGQLIASWRNGDDRLVIISGQNDRVRWSVRRNIDGELEVATGVTTAARLPRILESFDCEKLYKA
jgi:hypothetical protein